jgi:DNA-binding NtrC family response regulator
MAKAFLRQLGISTTNILLPTNAQGVRTPASYNFTSHKEGGDKYERNYTLRKLAESDGQIIDIAKALGINRSHF